MADKVLFLGLSTLDIQYRLSKLPEKNKKVSAEDMIYSAGGPAANAAVAYRYLNGDSELWTIIGAHPLSDLIRNDFDKLSLKYMDLLPDIKQLIIASIFTTSDGSRTVVSYKNKSKLPEVSVEEIYNKVGAFDYILYDGFYPEVFGPLIKRAKENNAVIVYDGGSWKEETALLAPLIDIAIFSAEYRLPGSHSFEDMKIFCGKNGIKKFAVTHGDKPLHYFDGRSEGLIPVPQVEVVDTLGAGDFFHGAFMYYYQSGYDFKDSLQKASLVASKSCRHFGTREWMFY